MEETTVLALKYAPVAVTGNQLRVEFPSALYLYARAENRSIVK